MTNVKSDYSYELQREISGGIYEVFGEQVNFTIPKSVKGALQVTHGASGGNQEYIPSALKDNEEFTVTFNLVTTVSGLIYDWENDVIRAYKIVSPGDVLILDFDAFITSVEFPDVDYQSDKPAQFITTFRPTGTITYSGSGA